MSFHLKNLQVLPFNIKHSIKAGAFARTLFEVRKGNPVLFERLLIPNDAKLFSQADTEENISLFITSDTRSLATYKTLKDNTSVKFDIIDINLSHFETFGLLSL